MKINVKNVCQMLRINGVASENADNMNFVEIVRQRVEAIVQTANLVDNLKHTEREAHEI